MPKRTPLPGPPDERAIDARLAEACNAWRDTLAKADELDRDAFASAINDARQAWWGVVEQAIVDGGRYDPDPERYRLSFDQVQSTNGEVPPAFHEAVSSVGGWQRYLTDPDGIAHNTRCGLLDGIQPPPRLDWWPELSGVTVDDATRVLGNLCHACHWSAQVAATAQSREWRLEQ